MKTQISSNDVLAKMGRHYTAGQFSDFAKFALENIPGLHLGTDIITGFPGETDAMFTETADFLRSNKFANVHIFRYSPREGTPAASFPEQIPSNVAGKRAEILGKIADEAKQQFIRSQIGSELQVLIEKQISPGVFTGWSDNYVKVTFNGHQLREGSIINVKINNENVLSL